MALCSPVFTSYKHFTKRWEWNEWIKLPVKYSDLPRTARLAVTIYDCCGAGGGGADTRRQVWTLTIKLSNIREVILVKKIFHLPGGQVRAASNPSSTPHWGSIILYRSF